MQCWLVYGLVWRITYNDKELKLQASAYLLTKHCIYMRRYSIHNKFQYFHPRRFFLFASKKIKCVLRHGYGETVLTCNEWIHQLLLIFTIGDHWNFVLLIRYAFCVAIKCCTFVCKFSCNTCYIIYAQMPTIPNRWICVNRYARSKLVLPACSNYLHSQNHRVR